MVACGDAVVLEDIGKGWPVRARLASGPALKIFVGRVGAGGRNRAGELRFQNPGRSELDLSESDRVHLLGVHEADGVMTVVAFDADRHADRVSRRSFFLPL